MAATQLFPEWAPDLSTIGTGIAKNVSGCVPKKDGYAPFFALLALAEPLPGRCRGSFFARRSDGSVAIFAATSTRIYLLDNTDLTWTDVSQGGTAYTALVDGKHWEFVQYNDVVIAVQVNTPPQAFALSSSSEFADLGGSPPQAAHIAVVNRFIVLTGILSQPRRVQWCDLDAITTWTAGVGLADYQDLPDGGLVSKIAGGDAFGIILQDESVRSLVYAPGSAVTFQINRIATNDPLFATYSVITAGDKVFYISSQGFKVITAGGTPQSIGKERVDTTFFDDVDADALELVLGAHDPRQTRVYWSYKSKSASAGVFDKIICFDWSIGKEGRWSLLNQNGEYLSTLAAPGLTLEGLDAISASLDALGFSLDTISSAVRGSLAGFTTSHEFGFFNGDSMEAIIETAEQDGEGRFLFASEVLVLTDCADAAVSIGYRSGPRQAPQYSPEQTVDTDSRAYPLIEDRYLRARVRFPAGSSWSFAMGVQPEGSFAGTE